MRLDSPAGFANRTARLGSLERKAAAYDVWLVGDEPSDLVAAEELKNLSLVVPRRTKRGRLFSGLCHSLI